MPRPIARRSNLLVTLCLAGTLFAAHLGPAGTAAPPFSTTGHVRM